MKEEDCRLCTLLRAAGSRELGIHSYNPVPSDAVRATPQTTVHALEPTRVPMVPWRVATTSEVAPEGIGQWAQKAKA